MFVVMGATGNTGKLVAERLLAAGAKVRVIGRSAERLAPLVAKGAFAAVGRAEDAGFLSESLRGASAGYAMVPPDYGAADPVGWYDRVGNAVAEGLRTAAVGRVVFLSSLGAELADRTGLIKGLHRVEERLRAVPGIDLTLLRPGYFMENHFASLGAIKHLGVNPGTLRSDAALIQVATADIAEVAAEVLRETSGSGTRVVEIHGPRPLTMAQATAIIGQAIGKPDLRYVEIPAADLVAALKQAGFSENVASMFVEMNAAFNAGLVRSLAPATTVRVGKTGLEQFGPAFAAAFPRG